MAIAQGMGDTTRSSLDDGGGAYTAPATIWLNEGFDASAGARIGSGSSRLYQASALDSQTGPIGMGIQWFRHDQTSSPSSGDLPGWKKPGESFSNPTSTSVLSASLSTGGVHHLISYAAGLRYYMRTAPVTGESTEINGVLSVGFRVQEQLIVTLTGENIIPQSGFDGVPLGVGTGVRWQPVESFGLAVDTFTDLESDDSGAVVSPMVGAEYRIQGTVPIRVGWRRDGLSGSSFATAGLGVSNEQAGLHYGASLQLGEQDDLRHWHGLSLQASF
jgi:hypothetical protein